MLFSDMIFIMSEVVKKLHAISSGHERSLGVGEYLFHRCDPVLSLFLVLGGTVQLLRYQDDGNALILQRTKPGDIIAEASLFSGTYHCDAVVDAPAIVWVVSKMNVLRIFREDPDFAEAWAVHLAREMQSARLKCEMLSLKTVALRLDAWLTWNEGIFPVKGQWKVVASEIGVSPESLYREFARRRKETG